MSLETLNKSRAYGISFGDYADETRYAPGLSGFDANCKEIEGADLRKDIRKNKAEMMQKASAIGGLAAGTTDVTLIPVYVDPEIIDLTRINTPMIELVPRVTNYGKTADYNQITTLSNSVFYAEDAALTDQDDVYARQSVSIKYLYAVGRVTGPMIAASKQYLASGGYVDALALEVKNRTLGLRRKEEDTLFNGDATTNVLEFDGLYQLIYDNGATERTDKATTALELADMRTGIRTARGNGGNPNLIVCDLSTYDDVKALIQDELRYPAPTANIAWGIQTISFEGIPLMASRNISTTSGSKFMLILDMSVIEMRVLQDVTYQDLAITNDSQKFMLKLYEVLVLKAPQFCHLIFAIS